MVAPVARTQRDGALVLGLRLRAVAGLREQVAEQRVGEVEIRLQADRGLRLFDRLPRPAGVAVQHGQRVMHAGIVGVEAQGLGDGVAGPGHPALVVGGAELPPVGVAQPGMRAGEARDPWRTADWNSAIAWSRLPGTSKRSRKLQACA